MGFYSQAFVVFLMKESKKRRRKQPGKLMATSHSQLVNLPGAWPLMNQLGMSLRLRVFVQFRLISVARYVFKSPSICF